MPAMQSVQSDNVLSSKYVILPGESQKAIFPQETSWFPSADETLRAQYLDEATG